MKKNEIRVGGYYTARISGRFVTVRVDAISQSGPYFSGAKREVTVYDVTNLATGRKTTFRSAAKFRSEAREQRQEPKTSTRIGYHGDESDPLSPKKPEEQWTEFLADCSLVEASEGSDPTDSIETETQTTTPPSSQDVAGVPTVAQIVEGEQRPDPTVGSVVQTENFTAATLTSGDSSVHTNVSLAAKISAARQGRAVGSPVAGMTPNAEQESILEVAIADDLHVLVIGAGAGTGKTATLKMLEQVLHGRGQYTAFNASLVAESKAKFVRASCNTTHSLAFREVGKRYAHRLNSDRVNSYQIARTLGIEAFTVTLKGMGVPDDDGKPTDKLKVLQPGFLAGQVIVAIRKFCQSADRAIGEQHLKRIGGIDVPNSRENDDRVRAYLLPFCEMAWADMCSLTGTLPFSHDVYVKIWQLGTGADRPVIAADYILLDEYQDTAPVFVDILKQQTQALIILVGDDNQRIYEWRGAINAGDEFPDAERRLLGQSYRFGQIIADVANAVLRTLEVPTDLVMRGMPTIPSRVDTVASPRCYLYRTNAGAISRVMACVAEGKRPALIGGKTYVEDMVRWMQASIDLQAKRGTQHPELSCFESWGEVVEYSKTDEGDDLRLMCKLVDEFGAQSIRNALKDMPKEEDADCVITTVHKSKGREWDTVKLGSDFPTINKMGDSDRRLLYVATTRAKLVLDISECPPFIGGYDGTGDQKRWVPGLRITYTVPMPMEDGTYVRDEVKPTPNVGINDSWRMVSNQPALTTNGNGATGEFTWANMGGEWCVRGPAHMTGRVEVVRKNGTKSQVTLGNVVRKIGDFWFYKV